MSRPRLAALLTVVSIQLVAGALTAFTVCSWTWVSYEVECLASDFPDMVHSPGAWVATHAASVWLALMCVGHVLPTLAVFWIEDAWRAVQTQFALSALQIVLALVLWMHVLTCLEAYFHAHNCWCEAPEISLSELELTPRSHPHERALGCSE